MEKENKIGLVLEGGGMRGMYTAGVLDVFMEEGLMPDGVIGVSAGAVHGCNFLAQQYGRSVRYNLKYINDKRYVSLKSLIKTGDLFNVEFCYDTIPNELNKFDYEKFKENAKDVPFYVGCTNVETGEPEYIRCTDLKDEMPYLRASASLPLVSKIVEVGDKKLLDGGVADSIPVAFFRSIGFKKNIVILTRPEGYEKKADPTIGVIEKVYSQYPEFIETCRERSESYNRAVDYIEYYERHGQNIIIRPSKNIKIGRIEKDVRKLKYMYKLGRYDTKKKLEQIKEFMA